MGKIINLFEQEEEEDNKPVQRFYIYSEKNKEITHSTVDVKSLMALFNNENISLSEETIDNLDKALINAVEDYYCNFKAEIGLHQLLTMTALYCSYSAAYKESKEIHDNSAFSYFVCILDIDEKEGNEMTSVVRDKVLPIDRPIMGDLLDDIFEAMVKEQHAMIESNMHISSSAL
jgi:hypothetical protein